MHGEDAFKVEGIVIEVLPNRTCWVELPNGHRLRGYAPGRAAEWLKRANPGTKVRLQLSAYDLSEGRILLDREKVL